MIRVKFIGSDIICIITMCQIKNFSIINVFPCVFSIIMMCLVKNSKLDNSVSCGCVHSGMSNQYAIDTTNIILYEIRTNINMK